MQRSAAPMATRGGAMTAPRLTLPALPPALRHGTSKGGRLPGSRIVCQSDKAEAILHLDANSCYGGWATLPWPACTPSKSSTGVSFSPGSVSGMLRVQAQAGATSKHRGLGGLVD